jgi:hypothetical protein
MDLKNNPSPVRSPPSMQAELLTSLAVMHLQTAFFHPTAEGSSEAFRQYLETQYKIIELQIARLKDMP